MDTSYIDCICNCAHSEPYSSIRIHLLYEIWSLIRLLILIRTMVFKHHLITNLIFIRYAFRIFDSIILSNQVLFMGFNSSPICQILYVQYHVSAEHQLARRGMQSRVICRTYSECCHCEDAARSTDHPDRDRDFLGARSS